MEKRSGRRRYTSLFFWVLSIGCVAFFALFFVFRASGSRRMNVVIATDPVIIWSWDNQDQTSVLITIPSDTVLDAVHGYGKYSLASLWKLGDIDRKEGAILARTTAETLAIPVPWYIGFSRSELVKVTGPDDALTHAFGPTSVGMYLRGGFRTNLPIGMYLRFMRAFVSRSEGKTKRLILSSANALTQITLPDGSSVKTVDIDRLDLALDDDFEDAAVRAEALHVAVLNTTGTPTLGNRFARILSHIGASVVMVGNSEAKILPACELAGSQTSLRSITAQAIKKEFGCIAENVRQEEGQADLTVLVGEGYASLFAPRASH